MIKVIEHGNRCRREIQCSQCGCRFSYEQEDIIKNNYYSRNQEYVSYTCSLFEVICPECEATIQVPYWEDSYIPRVAISDGIITYIFPKKDDEDEKD